MRILIGIGVVAAVIIMAAARMSGICSQMEENDER